MSSILFRAFFCPARPLSIKLSTTIHYSLFLSRAKRTPRSRRQVLFTHVLPSPFVYQTIHNYSLFLSRVRLVRTNATQPQTSTFHYYLALSVHCYYVATTAWAHIGMHVTAVTTQGGVALATSAHIMLYVVVTVGAFHNSIIDHLTNIYSWHRCIEL